MQSSNKRRARPKRKLVSISEGLALLPAVLTAAKCERYIPRYETIRIESIVVWTRANGTQASIGQSQDVRVLRNAGDEGIT